MTNKDVLPPDINEFGSQVRYKADIHGIIVELIQTLYGVSIKGEEMRTTNSLWSEKWGGHGSS